MVLGYLLGICLELLGICSEFAPRMALTSHAQNSPVQNSYPHFKPWSRPESGFEEVVAAFLEKLQTNKQRQARFRMFGLKTIQCHIAISECDGQLLAIGNFELRFPNRNCSLGQLTCRVANVHHFLFFCFGLLRLGQGCRRRLDLVSVSLS